MPILGLDLGGSKLAVAVFSETGSFMRRETIPLARRKGGQVGVLIAEQIQKNLAAYDIRAIGVSVPGISHHKTGTVWAPNIEGWDDYPLMDEVRKISQNISVTIDNDRACSILGEQWQGNANGCKDAIFITVGTGIGAGILADGNVLRGSNDAAGAIGWMTLSKPYKSKYASCGFLEYHGSGAGIPKFVREILASDPTGSVLRIHQPDEITAAHIFDAFEEEDPIASIIVRECISYWGMATANLVSIFNPEKILFGGGFFGPAAKYIADIKEEAHKWAQPISIKQVEFGKSKLEGDAAVYGAAFLALKNITR